MLNYHIPSKLLAIIACLLWSSSVAAIKMGLAEFPYPFSFAGMRFMIAGLMLAPLWLRNRDESLKSMRENWRKILLVAFLNIFLQYLLYYMCVFKLPSALVAIIIGSSPLNTAVVAHFLLSNEKMTPGKIGAIFIGIGGIVLISLARGLGNEGTWGDIWYILLTLCALSSGTFGGIFVKKLKEPIPLSPYLLSSLQLFLGGVGLMVASGVSGETPVFEVTALFWQSLIWLSIVSAGAFTLWFYLIQNRKVPVTDLNQWKFIVPFFGALLSWLLIDGENPTYSTIGGMILIIFSLILYDIAARKEVKNLLNK